MPEHVLQAEAPTDRKSRFRAYMARFNPTAPALRSIDQKLVVDRGPESVHAQFAVRADLEPGSQQLLVGGIGSGKTTELLLTERLLKQESDVLAVYIFHHL